MKVDISIGSDHAGFQMKAMLVNWLKSCGFNVHDEGCYSEERADYPDYAHKVATKVVASKTTTGILLCGSGNGIAMSANKHQGIRAALCWSPEIAQLAKQHNNANILVLPARYLSEQESKEVVNTFLNTGFEGGRHEARVAKIDL